MHTNLLIALVSLSVAAEHPKCAHICKLMSFGLGHTTDKSWSKACSCFAEKQYKSEVFKPWSEVGPVVKLDNSGIYYEPAEIPPSQLSYIDQPFYIVNPVRAKEDRSLKKHTTKYPFKNYYNYMDDGDINSFRKQKRRENIPDPNLDLKRKEIPIYLDIDVKESTDVLRQVLPIEETKIPLLTEEVLINCMDLYVLIQSRKKNSNSNLKEIWGDTKFKKYADLTDSQLKSEIKDKCSQPTNIVEQSRKDIFQNSPTKSKSELRLAQNEYNNLNNDYKTFQHSMVKYKLDTEASTVLSSTLGNTVPEEIVSRLNNAEGSNNFSEETTSPIKLNINKILPNILNKNNNSYDYNRDDQERIESMQSTTDKTDFYLDKIETTLSYLSERETEMKTQSVFQTRKSNLNKIQSTAEPATHNTHHTDEYFSLQHSTVQAVGLAYPTNKKDIDIRSTLISKAFTTDNSINNEKFTNIYLATIPPMEYYEPLDDNASNHVTRKNYVSSTSDNSINTDDFTNSYLTTPYIRQYHIQLDDNPNPNIATTDNSLDNDLSATTLPTERIIYSEKDVILPKIITTEFSNDTVRSNVNGSEQIPNNDFKTNISNHTFPIEVNGTEQIHSNGFEKDFRNEIIWSEVNGTERIPNADFKNNAIKKTVWSEVNNTEQLPNNYSKNDDSNGTIWKEINGNGRIPKNYFNNYANNETVWSEVNSTEQLPNIYLKNYDSNVIVWSEINRTEQIPNIYLKNDDRNGTVRSKMNGTAQILDNYLKNDDSNGTMWSVKNATRKIPKNYFENYASNEIVWSELNSFEQQLNNYFENDVSDGTVWIEINGTDQIPNNFLKNDGSNSTIWTKINGTEQIPSNYSKNDDSNGKVRSEINDTEQIPKNHLKNDKCNGTVWSEINETVQIPHNYSKNDDNNGTVWSEMNSTRQVLKYHFKNDASNDIVRSEVNGIEKMPNNDFINYVSNDTIWNETKQISNNNFNKHDVESLASNNEDVLKNRKRLTAKNSYEYGVLNFNHEKVKENISSRSENTDQNVSGKLYFFFNKEMIPAKFIQNSEGQINVGMDGISLCDKLKLTNETSKLLSMICKCVRTQSCESK